VARYCLTMSVPDRLIPFLVVFALAVWWPA
jgi:hypothetical protein